MFPNGLDRRAMRNFAGAACMLAAGAAALVAGGRGRGQVLDASKAPGPLSRPHAEPPGPGPGGCGSCHEPDYSIKPEKCLACHEEIAVRVRQKRGFHAEKAEGCGACHAEHRGPEAFGLPFDPARFDHALTGTVLDGAHANPGTCDRCHYPAIAFPRKIGISYLLPDARCLVCHLTPHPQRGPDCQACHTTDRWRSDRVPRPL